MVHRSARSAVQDHAFASTRFAMWDLHMTSDGGRREPDLHILRRLLRFLFRRLTSKSGYELDPNKHNLLDLWWKRISPLELDGESIPTNGHFTEVLYIGVTPVYMKETVYVAGRACSPPEEQGDARVVFIGHLAERYRSLVRVVMHGVGEKRMHNPTDIVNLTELQAEMLEGREFGRFPKPPHPQYTTLKQWCSKRGYDLTLERMSPHLVKVVLTKHMRLCGK